MDLSGVIIRSGGKDKRLPPAKSDKFSIRYLDSINGSMNTQVADTNGKQTSHKMNFKTFRLNYKISDEAKKELQEIKADPLGDGPRKEAEIAFYMQNVKCDGTLEMDGKSYDCAQVTKRMIIRHVNGN
ncbi:MAG: hypothetical protein JWQ35_2454 [Bacteriovoracaceae bacterium]|nr:hypothetical protein [Bacteriovoracaceae bacterium]